MSRTRRTLGKDFKAKVVLVALKSISATAEMILKCLVPDGAAIILAGTNGSKSTVISPVARSMASENGANKLVSSFPLMLNSKPPVSLRSSSESSDALFCHRLHWWAKLSRKFSKSSVPHLLFQTPNRFHVFFETQDHSWFWCVNSSLFTS